MTPEIRRQELIGQIKSYQSILASKGIPALPVPEEALKDMDEADLTRVLKDVKDLARTPN